MKTGIVLIGNIGWENEIKEWGEDLIKHYCRDIEEAPKYAKDNVFVIIPYRPGGSVSDIAVALRRVGVTDFISYCTIQSMKFTPSDVLALFNGENISGYYLKKMNFKYIVESSSQLPSNGDISFNIALIIIFNHRYDVNICKLRDIYGRRFKYIRFIVPFYDGKDTDVIPVYESSFQFQGYIAQALSLLEEIPCDSYFFIADDLFLNPVINERNIQNILNVKRETAYCDTIMTLSKVANAGWPCDRVLYAASRFKPYLNEYGAVNYKGEILDTDKAFAIAAEKGFTDFTVNIAEMINNNCYDHKKYENMLKLWLDLEDNVTKIVLPYPLFASYSDWFIIPKSDIRNLAHCLGVFAAIRLFAEIAIPTGMFFCCKNLKSSDELFLDGQTVWENYKRKDIEIMYKYDIDRLIKEFPEDLMFIHPIKLSKWTYHRIV